MTTYQEFFSPASLAIDIGSRDFFEPDDVESGNNGNHHAGNNNRGDGDGDDSKAMGERMLDSSLDTCDPFLPKTADWPEFSPRGRPASRATPAAPVFRRPPPPPLHQLQSQPSQQQQPPPQLQQTGGLVFRSPPEAWPSGVCTPATAFGGLASDFDGNASAPPSSLPTNSFWSASVAADASGANCVPASAFDLHDGGHDPHAIPVYGMALSTDGSLPTSPLGDWPSSGATAVGAGDRLELRGSVSGHARLGSPLSPQSPLLRRDGIRKKNARFDIPPERTLNTIDDLIAKSSDDQLIKELKQQKRLLRNRQAALDSRQRKKLHTERLEEEKKHFTSIISDLEEQLRVRDANHRQLEEDWRATQRQLEQYIENLHLERDEMIRSHTLETSDLRKKNAYLADHIQRLDGAAMSAVPGSSAFSADFSDVGVGGDGLGLDGNSWESYPFLSDFSVDEAAPPEHALAPAVRKPERMLTAAAPPVVPAPVDPNILDDKPTASGLLLLLLLCGAFVASKSSTSSTPSIPRLPDEIRAASATVLDNIFRDAGVAPQDRALAGSVRPSQQPRIDIVDQPMMMSDPSPWPSSRGSSHMVKGERNDGSVGGDRMVGLTASSLDVLQRQLVQPTRAQEEEQLFSLTASQYGNVVLPPTDACFDDGMPCSAPAPSSSAAAAAATGSAMSPPMPSTMMSQGRRELGAGLAAMRNRHKSSSAAEVYTRSLLWDKVPAEVVRDFARTVAASNSHHSHHHHQSSTSASAITTTTANNDNSHMNHNQNNVHASHDINANNDRGERGLKTEAVAGI